MLYVILSEFILITLSGIETVAAGEKLAFLRPGFFATVFLIRNPPFL